MAPQCISRSCWCSPWPLLGHQAEVSWAEPPVQWYRDVGQPAYSSGTVEGTAAPTPTRSVPSCWRAWLARLRVPGQLTGSCCCSCKSAISVGETRCLSAGQLCYTVPVLPDSFSTLFQCLQTAPLLCPPVPPDSFSTLYPGASRQLFYTASVPPDSSSTLSPGRCVTLLLPVLLASARFCRGAAWGVREAGWKHGWRVTSQRLL